VHYTSREVDGNLDIQVTRQGLVLHLNLDGDGDLIVTVTDLQFTKKFQMVYCACMQWNVFVITMNMSQ